MYHAWFIFFIIFDPTFECDVFNISVVQTVLLISHFLCCSQQSRGMMTLIFTSNQHSGPQLLTGLPWNLMWTLKVLRELLSDIGDLPIFGLVWHEVKMSQWPNIWSFDSWQDFAKPLSMKFSPSSTQKSTLKQKYWNIEMLIKIHLDIYFFRSITSKENKLVTVRKVKWLQIKS